MTLIHKHVFEIQGRWGHFGSTSLDILLTSRTEDEHISKHVCFTSCRHRTTQSSLSRCSPFPPDIWVQYSPSSHLVFPFPQLSMEMDVCFFFCLLPNQLSAVWWWASTNDGAFLDAAAGNYADESSECSKFEGCKIKPIICIFFKKELRGSAEITFLCVCR